MGNWPHMELFFIGLVSVYLLLVVLLIIGWQGTQAVRRPARPGYTGLVTVVVAMRNEAGNIARLLHDLCRQEDDALEIILVDDRSEDDTLTIAQATRALYPHRRISLLTPDEGTGKKNALTYGIKHAQGDVILTTDADCRVGPNWVASLRPWFGREEVKFVLGGVKIQAAGSFWAAMQALEFSSLIATGAATLWWGVPSMCNGANLAYRRAVFLEVGGYEGNAHVPSGDDEFLLRKVFARYPRGICFNHHPQGVVSTAAQPSLAAFVHQRVRWAGKWRQHKSAGSMALAVFIFLVHAGWIGWGVWALWHGNALWFGLAVAIKALLEAVLLTRVARFLNVSWHWTAFLIQELLYSFYAVFFGLMANGRSFTWKGRKFSPASR